MSLQGKKREYSNCVREKLEYLSLEENSEFDTDTDEMSDTKQDIIDFKDEENESSKTKLILSHVQPSTSFSSHKPPSLTTTSDQLQYSKNIDRSNEPFDKNNQDNLIAIYRAKNLIAFFRALHGGQFRNVDLNYYVVISDGQLIGIYENEEKACQVAAQTNFNIGNQVGDGMVFPISGNFKSRKKSSNRNYIFPRV
ncbi:unnamed protein product [Rhizophagus irregularis]|nr:unnamed protein product [Rhizophagus irregularis]CAB5384995.1 unnamed protein product [Rhizophagus irregularis]